jgi:hypothetical protein
MKSLSKAKKLAGAGLLLLSLTVAGATASGSVPQLGFGPVVVAHADGCDSNPPNPSLDCPPAPTPTPTPAGH